MLKRWRKKLFKHPLAIRALCALIACYIRLVRRTSRVRMEMPEETKPYADGRLPAVFVFWHGRLLMMPAVKPPGRRMHVMTSRHADGEMIARTMDHFGISAVRGSSSRGGAAAAAAAIAALEAGGNLSITPDGPRGPAREVQPGAARIAAHAGVPVVPVTYAASRGKCMRSWDSFFIPYPFAELAFMAGPPVMIGKEQAESAAPLLRESLLALDGACGRAFAKPE